MTDIFAAYLKRLGLAAPASPDLAALTELMASHMQTVPFENLDVMGGTPRPLSTNGVLQKIAADFQGGFCYELNEAFRALLDHLGFAVHRIEARVWQPTNQRFGAPFDHLALVVSLPQGNFLVDVGFGDSNRSPMRLPADRTRDVSGEYRLAPLPRAYLRLSSHSQDLYEMTLAEQPLEAFAPMCRYHQTSPESIFSKGLICTRATAMGRITVSRERLIIMHDGKRMETVIASLPAVLHEHFGITHVGTTRRVPATPEGIPFTSG